MFFEDHAASCQNSILPEVKKGEVKRTCNLKTFQTGVKLHAGLSFTSPTCNNPLNLLSGNGKLSYHENLTFLWTWILKWVPRNFATHASLCNTLPSNKLCPKTVKILALKGLKKNETVKEILSYQNNIVLICITYCNNPFSDKL